MNDQKKQIPLRLSQSLWNELTAWAGDEFRSLNGQIEYLLTECVKWRRHGGSSAPAASSVAPLAPAASSVAPLAPAALAAAEAPAEPYAPAASEVSEA